MATQTRDFLGFLVCYSALATQIAAADRGIQGLSAASVCFQGSSSNMSLFSLGLLAAYFAGGVQFMMNQEGWDAADAFYFWSRAVHKSNCRGASAHG